MLTRKSVNHAEVSMDDVYACLKTLGYAVQDDITNKDIAIKSNTKSQQNFVHLVEMVAQYYNLSVADLKSESRKKEITNARQILMLIAKRNFGRTLEKIGDYFGGKGHAAVIYAINNIEKKCKSDQDISHDYNVFIDRLEK